nr:hypothetical protein CFP56_13992 [Quercus suber]
MEFLLLYFAQSFLQLPLAPYFKVNFDGVVFRDSNEAGLVVVIWDSREIVLASRSKKVSLPPSSDDVEALAAVQALLFAQELGIYSLIIKGDSKIVIKTLRSKDESFASFGHLLINETHYRCL